MSQRVKRPNRSDDGSVPTKRRKRPAPEEEETASVASWHPRPLNDLKGIYNRTTTEAPAELFRKDLISAMKLPDSEPLAAHEYWVICDQWKQEWERGVQVPVNPDSLPEPCVTVTHCTNSYKSSHEFKLPKNKYVRITNDERFKSEDHVLSKVPKLAEAACSYDLDECDVLWLKLINEERTCMGLSTITEDQLERVLEQLEVRCWDKIQSILKNEEGLGIEYDENVVCDVCRSPDSEDGNEMVFCDSCNICVHQACYGIMSIPEGQWLCGPCAEKAVKPCCVLCPNPGGAMKSTRSGKHYAHVSCSLWIPEVSIGCVERMEPITKISSIPQTRWALVCVLCRERVGACIQCSVRSCKTAYHVTCAFKHGLEMRAIIEDDYTAEGVRLRSYCEKHSKLRKRKKISMYSGSEDDDKLKKRKDTEENNLGRATRLQEIEAEFYVHVTVKDVVVGIDVDMEALNAIYNYWKLKRKAGNNKPLLPPKSDDVDMLSHKQEQADLEKMKMFVQLRQDLERVRNLCYMVSRREKLSRTFFRMREQTFHKQVAVLSSGSSTLSSTVIQAVMEANHGPSIYDRLYSHASAEDHTSDFDGILAKIAGLKSSGDEKRSDFNGVFKENNPYKKIYVNGSKRRSSSLYGSMSSSSSSDERPKDDKENRVQSSSDDGMKVTHKRGQKPGERRQKRISRISKSKIETSSDEDIKPNDKWKSISKSRLVQMENELGISGSDSDELMPLPVNKHKEATKAMASIYSDSDSSDTSARNDAASDSQQSKMRTKAAMKDFTHKPTTSKLLNKSSQENKKRTKEETKREPATKKKDYVPSDLIVPQRQAAKKASENLKTSTTRVKEQPQNEQENTEKEKKSIDDKEKSNKSVRVKGRPPLKDKEIIKEKEKTEPKKEIKSDIFEIDKEMEKSDNQEPLAYVPQRQAAKKATESMKGLGTKPLDNAENKASEGAKVKKDIEAKKKEEEKPAKISESERKSSSNSSTSSSSSSSSDSSSTSSSDSEDNDDKPQSESQVSAAAREQTKRSSNKDWPFLDKAPKSPVTSSSSDSSDSSRPPTPTPPKPKAAAATPQPARKSIDKKPTSAVVAAPPEREESSRRRGAGRRGRGRPRVPNAKSSSGDRLGDTNVRHRAVAETQRRNVDRKEPKSRKGKPNEDQLDEKETDRRKSTSVSSPIRKTEKKLSEKEPSPARNLEKEILERRGSTTSQSTLDRLFGPERKEKPKRRESERRERLSKSPQKAKSPEKVARSPTISDRLSKSPIKNKENEIVRSPDKKRLKEDKPPEKLSISPAKENKEPKEIAKSPNKNKNKVVEVIDLEEKIISVVEDKEEELEPVQIQTCSEIKFDEKVDAETIVDNQNRSIFSPAPQHEKETDLFDDFDNIFDNNFGIGKDEMLKSSAPIPINTIPSFKEDTKEDSARETLNLVEKLRMGLSKKSTTYDFDDAVSITSSRNDADRNDLTDHLMSVQDATQKDENLEVNSRVSLEMKLDVTVQEFKRIGDTKELRYSASEINIQANDLLMNQHDQHSHHTVTAEADERWVPPSEPYPNMQSIDPNRTQQNNVPEMPYLSNFDTHTINSSSTHIDNNIPQVENAILPPQVEAKMPSPNVTQTPFMDTASMDYMPSPSPYVHPQAKWADRHVMPSRRSSSSSAASTVSSPQRKPEEEDIIKRQEKMLVNSMEFPFHGLHISHSLLDNFAPAFQDPQSCIGPVSLFPPPNINNQLPFPSPGAGMFPPPPFGAPFPSMHTMMNAGLKPVEDQQNFPSPCTAAFTSSQHNMALTAAMVNPPIQPPLPKDSSHDVSPEPVPTETLPQEIIPSIPEEVIAVPPPPIPQQQICEETLPVNQETPPVTQEEVPPSPALSNSTPNSNHIQPSPNPSLKSNSSAGKKSPAKPTRTSARFQSQQNKSPSKSPGKSPRQEVLRSTTRIRNENKRSNKVSSGRGSQVQSRNRGRGRGRGRGTHHNDYDVNTIHNKLVGTVYDLDFDDDITSESMSDLRAMRERRKSLDIHERNKADISRDSSASPKFTSPSSQSHKRFNADLSELRPPTPIEDPKVETSLLPNRELTQTFPDIVPPVLPGPVDMRTYSGFDSQTYNESNLLGAFSATGAPTQRVHEEIDEDLEKEFQTALSKKTEEPPPPEVSNIKVSLSDSRNQLKVKIKGPIANYTSNIAPLPPVTVHTSSNSAASSVPSVANSVTTNPGATNWRMRKKELLWRYCMQDMNMDDPSATTSTTPAAPTLNRTIITIPKAVASMTSIPTKEDYRDYRTNEDLTETKHRKESKNRSMLSRELRQLDIPVDDEALERRRSASSGSLEKVRRGRPPRTVGNTPKVNKLKIRISGNNSIIEGPKTEDNKKDAVRPPKKRLPTVAKPTVEDLKRESMKFRKQVMADFGEVKKRKKDKDKSGRKKKRRKHEVQIISKETTKLVIRLHKKNDNERTSGSAVVEVKVGANETTPDTLKVVPIKLKLSRCQEGSGYVMKTTTPPTPPSSTITSEGENGKTDPIEIPTSLVPSSVQESPVVGGPLTVPLPLNKDCEVR